jgi:hydrogenase nickel incorporation protein HypA/HybF
MHEIGLVDDILRAIEGKLKCSGENAEVKKVNILIGELEHITPDHFEFHFRERVKGTNLETAELSFKKVEARFKCKDCAREFSIESGTIGCPGCGSNANDVIAGSGIYVESVEVKC